MLCQSSLLVVYKGQQTQPQLSLHRPLWTVRLAHSSHVPRQQLLCQLLHCAGRCAHDQLEQWQHRSRWQRPPCNGSPCCTDLMRLTGGGPRLVHGQQQLQEAVLAEGRPPSQLLQAAEHRLNHEF